MYTLTIGLTYEENLRLEEKYRYDFLLFDYKNSYPGSGIMRGLVFVFRTLKKYVADDVKNNVLLDTIHYQNLNGAEIASHGDCHYHFLDTSDDIEKGISLSDEIEIVRIKNEFEISYYAKIKNQTIVRQGHYGLDDSQPFKDKMISYKLFSKRNETVINCLDIELPYIFKLQKDHQWHVNRTNIARRSKLDLPDKNNKNKEIEKSIDIVKDAMEEERKYWRKKEQAVFDQLLEYRNNRLRYKVIEK